MNRPETVHRTACTLDCPDTCTLAVTVRDGTIVDIDASSAEDANPFSTGFICRKVQRSLRRVYSPRRLGTPLLRTGPKGSGEFREASWDEVLDLIATRIAEALAADGPNSVIPYLYNSSTGVLESDGATVELFARLGCPRVEHSICAKTFGDAWQQVYPGLDSADPLAIHHSQLLVVWGANPTVSNTHLPPVVGEFVRRGGTLVVIDPRRTGIAARADLHLPIIPGTDSILAMSMVSLLEQSGRLDGDFISSNVEGAEEFLAACREWSVEDAAAECGLDAGDIEKCADLIASTNPAMLRIGWGVERNRNGGSGMLAALSLWAVAGKFRRLGAGVLGSTSSATSEMLREALPTVSVACDTVNMNHVGRLMRGRLQGWRVPRVLFVQGANPAVSAVDQQGFLEGLAKDEIFTIVHDQVMTDTARFADVVLPATTQFEVDDAAGSYGSFVVQRVNKVVEPHGSARSNNQLGRDMAARLGVTLETPDAHELLDVEIRRTRGTDTSVQFRDVYPVGGVARVHVADSELPLPRPQRGRGMLGDRLRLITPATSRTVNSMFAEYDPPEVAVTINPVDAERHALTEGDIATLQNGAGSVTLPVKVSDAVRPGVCEIPKGLWMEHVTGGSVSNALVDDEVNDLGGGACFNEAVVSVRKERR